MNPFPEELFNETRDALAHFYDYAYLVNHPLVHRLQLLFGNDSALAVQKLRRLLLELIEGLRPNLGVPSDDAAWRSYTVLYHRYVLGQELPEVEHTLGLGRRQIQREQQRALRAISAALWDKERELAEAQPPSAPGGDVLWQEISRVAAEQQVVDAREQFERALALARVLAQQQGITLVAQPTTLPLLINGDAALFRQLLLATLSYVMRLIGPTTLTLRLERQQGEVVCTFTPDGPVAPTELPEAVIALARAQGIRITASAADQNWHLQLCARAAEQGKTVAIMEDNQDVVALFRRYLAGHGYRLVNLESSLHVVERVAELMPDIVVLDVIMHEADGWEVLQRLKSDPRLRPIPVVICSVLDEPQLATSLGAQAYLRKPVRPAQLLECLAGLSSPPYSVVVDR